MSSSVLDPSNFQTASASAFSVAARVAGIVIVFGYLWGLADGPVVTVVGALALITYGRSLLLDPWSSALSGGALAVLAGGLGIAALRWGALDVDAIRGAQAVLGPTILVAPPAAASTAAVAGAACLIALVLWVGRPWPSSRGQLAWWLVEAAAGSLAVLGAFFHPAAPGLGGGLGGVVGVLRWGLAAGLVVSLVVGLARLLRNSSEAVRIALLGIATIAVISAAGVLVTAL